MAKLEKWKTLQNIDEIMSTDDNSSPNKKWEVLLYFASSARKFEIFEQLIQSTYYSDTEIFEKFVLNNDYHTYFPKKALKLIATRATSIHPWKNFSSAEQVLNFHNRFISESDELFSKIKFFELHDPQICKQLIESKPAYYYIKNFTENQILSLSDDFIGYLAETIDQDLAFLPYKFQFSDAPGKDKFESKKFAILKICMHSPEKCKDTLNKFIVSQLITLQDFRGRYTAEQVNALPSNTKSLLKNPENVWKIFKNPELVYYNIPKGKHWEVFEYFAVKDPTIMRGLVNLKMNHSPFSRDAVIARYQNIDPKKLPPALKEFIESLIKLKEAQIENGKRSLEQRKQETKERIQEWLDKKGQLIQFFKLKDNIPITSKEEYFNIALFFKDSGLSVTSFCHKYQIDEIEGFRKMLLKVAEENAEFKQYYETTSATQQKEFVLTCKNNILDIVNEQSTIQSVIENSNSHRNLAKLVEMSDYLFNDPTITSKMVENIIEYYHSRLNSYASESFDLDNALKMLTFKEILFFIEPATLQKLNDGENVDLTREFTKSIAPIKEHISPESRQLLYSQQNGFKSKIKPYSTIFSREDYANSKTLIHSNNSEITITSEMIDMAECFAHENNLFRSALVMNKLIRAVADGRIQNKEETEAYKESLRKKIIEKMDNVQNLERIMLGLKPLE